MANLIYPLAKQAFISSALDLITGSTLKGMLVNIRSSDGAGNYYPFNASDQYLSSVPAGSRATAGVALTTKTASLGVFDADDLNFPAVTFAFPVGACIIYNDTGTAGTSQLIVYLDTITGFPVTPTGVDIQVVFDSGVNRIFAL